MLEEVRKLSTNERRGLKDQEVEVIYKNCSNLS